MSSQRYNLDLAPHIRGWKQKVSRLMLEIYAPEIDKDDRPAELSHNGSQSSYEAAPGSYTSTIYPVTMTISYSQDGNPSGFQLSSHHIPFGRNFTQDTLSE